MLRIVYLYFLLIIYIILSPSCLCYSRRLGPMEKKLGEDLDHLITKKKEEITKLQALSTINESKTLSSEAPIQHALVNHSEIKEKSTKSDQRVTLDKKVSSKRVSRTWKVPKYSKKHPRSDQEHPGFNLDYMQPHTHPPHHN